jgi:hypothetical protein
MKIYILLPILVMSVQRYIAMPITLHPDAKNLKADVLE